MKKKYKLILKYPGCQYQLNQIINTEFIWIDGIKAYLKDYPEFWEEIIEKDYEILEIKGYSGHYFLQKDGSFHYRGKLYGDEKTNCYAEKYLNSNYPHHIHSVKRLSDGKIFTVGDKLEDKGFLFWVIQSFRVIDNIVKVECERNPKITISASLLLNEISKKKNPLFTTEDGIDIYEGDKFVSLNKDTFWYHNANGDKYHSFKDKNILYFSTKEAAEEYILMNKPCLSINDILSFTFPQNLDENKYKEKLKQLVKSKL